MVANLIASAGIEKGLAIETEIDEAFYPAGIKVPDVDMEKPAIIRDEFHGEGKRWGFRDAEDITKDHNMTPKTVL